MILTTHFQGGYILSDLTKFWGSTVGILTKNSSEKSNAPHMPGVPTPSSITLIDAELCVNNSITKLTGLQQLKLPITIHVYINKVYNSSFGKKCFEMYGQVILVGITKGETLIYQANKILT